MIEKPDWNPSTTYTGVGGGRQQADPKNKLGRIRKESNPTIHHNDSLLEHVSDG